MRFLRRENLPGYFPYTAGVFPFKRDGEAPARMFAGEGDAFRTNRASRCCPPASPPTRLSTAFDSVTLYGRDPDPRPDIYGKVGTSGVSIATLDDMKVLYDGFDLCSPTTSVSMTINGPAPTILAMFLNTAIDQRLDRFRADEGREPDADEADELRAWVLANVRGTVQADILKEDQGQNTCIFSTEFALRAMADIQQYFVENKVRNFYSVSISGYHIAEAGANPLSQLAFTLANGFTYVEAYLARGMSIDDFAPNLSFFFSNGMDAEYTVLGRVARRIWAVAMRERYGASERSQKLKYHVQTSGRSLHAQEMDVQRHPHHAAGAVRALRQREQPAHQRLRRGGHHARRGVGPARAGHPDDHRPGVGPVDEREPAAGLATSSTSSPTWSRRRCWRSSTGSPSAAACSARWRPATSAGASRTSRCSTSTGSTTALPIIGVNTFSRVGRRGAADGGAGPGDRGGEAVPARPAGGLPRGAPQRGAGGAGARSGRPRWTAATSSPRSWTRSGPARSGQISEAFFEVGGQYRRNV